MRLTPEKKAEIIRLKRCELGYGRISAYASASTIRGGAVILLSDELTNLSNAIIYWQQKLIATD
ncbi:hypothetical protein ACM26S_06625 [Kluyvera sichuanensis]|uniref:hypothetical protein n=1 Tax=Kluyvera sichuanensis TaxID=2725494 RepID=UPI0039F70B3F